MEPVRAAAGGPTPHPRDLGPARAADDPAPGRRPERPRLRRPLDQRWFGGVCAGVAAHLGWPVWIVRVCFVLLVGADYLGIIFYGLAWLMIPAKAPEHEAPGLEMARRADMRRPSRTTRTANTGGALAVLVLCTGVLMLVRMANVNTGGEFFWPIILACLGVALVWRQAESPEQTEEDYRTPRWLAPLVSQERWALLVRMGLALILLGAAISLLAYSQVGQPYLPSMLAVAALTLIGFGVVAAPAVNRMRNNLAAAREAKIVSDARADMAAHLHDSVLQTLALIQRQANDPKAVASLARRQERELRAWLYGEQPGPETVKAALVEAGAAVEDELGVPIEVVCVGDAENTPGLEAMLRAAREAMMNASKHSGAAKIDVYAEVGPELVEVFIRDRGRGFDPNQIGDDRMGVKRSIIERMERYGGRAVIRTAPGEGTEVRLEMTR
ncbi:Phage shock protein, PspC, N-terminal [Propionibacterium ruminifibrarum]|uniref:Phage shock protein, PspC, N-terminal n=2 Tax=Propionibacterium ruminifibrarum TaxID=1962131 RepID=A0A375HZF9_9ACTN|nr:Phage shock protein, PspC, N-terminal [Propionibacterium ruminifibrarum]